MKLLNYLAAVSLATLATSASAQTLFDNTSGAVVPGWGYFNPGGAWGDEITLASDATVTSFSFDLELVNPGYANGLLQLAFHQVDAGPDGLTQTDDDMIGAALGSFTQAMSLANYSRFTFSGFSVAVPANFIYTVTNIGNLSYTLEATTDAAAIGTATNSNIWANFDGGLPVGTASAYDYADYYGNNQVRIEGTIAVPEPSTAYLLAGVAALSALMRFRRRRV